MQVRVIIFYCSPCRYHNFSLFSPAAYSISTYLLNTSLWLLAQRLSDFVELINIPSYIRRRPLRSMTAKNVYFATWNAFHVYSTFAHKINAVFILYYVITIHIVSCWHYTNIRPTINVNHNVSKYHITES